MLRARNQGKIREIRALLPSDIAVFGLQDLGLASPEETGATLRENADLKALYAAKASGMVTLATILGWKWKRSKARQECAPRGSRVNPPNDARTASPAIRRRALRTEKEMRVLFAPSLSQLQKGSFGPAKESPRYYP